jgi:hypothetical protein
MVLTRNLYGDKETGTNQVMRFDSRKPTKTRYPYREENMSSTEKKTCHQLPIQNHSASESKMYF